MDIIAFCSLHKQHEYSNIIKTSASNGDKTETVFSEISCGGYITADYEVSLTNYLVQTPIHNDVMVDIDLEEELNERGNGGNSDYGGDDVQYFDN